MIAHTAQSCGYDSSFTDGLFVTIVVIAFFAAVLYLYVRSHR